MTTAERTEKIKKIADLPGILEKAVAGLDDPQLDTPYREGGWTVRQVVHHLADSHMNALIRTKLMLTEERPPLKGYAQEDWARLPDSKLPVRPSLDLLKGLHERWTHLLQSITEEQWTRTGMHSESGQITLENILNTYSRHGENHVAQITGLRTGRGWR
jgi:hypothetical protein